jgi:2-iminobutanoate/2-iminopropanoate deaminase
MAVEHIWLEGSRPAGHYAPATAFGDLVFVSGQLPIGVEATASFDAQARQALANLFEVLHAAGTTRDRMLKVTVYIVGVELWPAFNTIYAELMGEARPARAVVPVPELHHGYLVEIEATAAR